MKKTIIDLFENSVKQYPDNPFPVSYTHLTLPTSGMV